MENKPICKIDGVGTKRWYNEDGLYHREYGPAIEYKNGDKRWYFNGYFHRLDGPAIIDGSGLSFWCINDHDVTDEIKKWVKDNGIDLDNLSEDDKLLIKLVWADYGR